MAWGWQPIETAPTDGTLIIGYSGPADSPDIACIRWVKAEELADEEDDDGDYVSGWSLADDIWFEQSPTHWMPLPRAPDAQ